MSDEDAGTPVTGGGIGILLETHGGNVIEGNFIGTDVSGTLDLGNEGAGVLINGTPNNTIGGTTPGARNIISGNGEAFTGIPISGIHISSYEAIGNLVVGNFIGTDITGSTPLGNSGNGVSIFTRDNIIGGQVPEARNIISGNLKDGISLGSGASTGGEGNIVQGNFIGTDVTGTKDLGNANFGVRTIIGADSTTIGGETPGAGNIISGNNGGGLRLVGSSMTVQGNLIGTDVTGTIAIGNGQTGIVGIGPSGLEAIGGPYVIGGTTTEARNVISGNFGYGLILSGPPGSNNLVQGNFIGVDVTGTVALANTKGGIRTNAVGLTIGGAEAGASNVISGNGSHGIEIPCCFEIVVQGNFIGTDLNATTKLGNSADGVYISSSNHTIGGTTDDAGNTIAFNLGNGVSILSGIQNAIQTNIIFSNMGLGIDLGNDGVTPNDSADTDTGPNNFQNFPEVRLTEIDTNGDLLIEYNVDSDPGHSGYPLMIQFFKSDPGGEGMRLLGEDVYATTDFNNDAKTVNLGNATELGITECDPIVAIVTDSSGNTSEFSSIDFSFTVNSTDDGGDSNPGDGICDDGTGNCTLRAAIEEANAISCTNTIRFDIPGPGPHTIQPSIALPTIIHPVIIDGTTEPDFEGTPIVELDGTDAGENVSGLQITAGNSIVRGLVINRFDGAGIDLRTSGSNLIEGNFIGTDITGAFDRGNSGSGIVMDKSSSDNTIGSMVSGIVNTIAFNGDDGVSVYGSGNRILSNSIFNNADLGIDLGFDGVTPNDSADVDTGPNNLQNFPEVTSVEINENEDLVIEYSVDSDPSHSAYPLTIQFFESDSSGQGKTLIGEDLYNATDFNNGAKKVNMGNAVELEVLGGDNIVATATDTSGNTSEFSPIKTVVIITSVAESEENVPKTFVLHQNYPNPFNPETTIQYQLPKTTQVKLVIYNLEGQQVATLVEKQQPAGLYSIQWDGKAASGKKVASGVYLYRLETKQFVQVRKLVLVR